MKKQKWTTETMNIEIERLNNLMRDKKIEKKDYLKQQIDLMQYSLDNFKLSPMKKGHIKKAMALAKLSLRFV